MNRNSGRARHSDVLVVGAGPVGLITALFLARNGWRVTVLEQRSTPELLPLPLHIDDEVARLLADAGLGDWLGKTSEPAKGREWRNADGTPLLTCDWTGLGPSGWPRVSMSFQPALQQALAEALEGCPNVAIVRSCQAVELVESERQVTVTAADTMGRLYDFTADWVVGADGAGSFVRRHMPARVADLGLFSDWLLVTVRPRSPHTWDPVNLQICDPARPASVVPGGLGRRCWEFMRRPGESVEDLDTDSAAWRLLAPYGVTPATSALEGHAVCTYQARHVDVWRCGRLLLAGDAAHLVPPFAGQGMGSGIQDAANLTFKLDLVLRGAASSDLLDTYRTERMAHIQDAIETAVELGKLICVTDAAAAAERDARMIGQGADPVRILPPPPPTVLRHGLIAQGAPGAAGRLSQQARISYQGHPGLLNEVAGRHFVVASLFDPRTLLSAHHLAFLHAIDARLLQMTASDSSADAAVAAVDLDDFYVPHLVKEGQVGVVIRPDHYLFGTASTPEAFARLVDDLEDQLISSRSSAPAIPIQTPAVTSGGER
ncbi:bifunctional 3-(3-hydroxy-phenyl)propionate/3-hydroxycinnamic acid hydroxylase [Streptomyces sp. NPDC127036]|uniref:bifunctional 3-(3-hydroxy-phenyl)propionate/3-hydroxycinnamic acid hydroxylase n=1 Tax=Streptomyces sp. NPDC127036 TaxID=3347112 RepID=UPI003668D859